MSDAMQMDDDLAEVGQVLEMCRSMLIDITRRAPGVKTFVDDDAFILNEVNPALVRLHRAATELARQQQEIERLRSLLTKALPKIGKMDFTPTACPNCKSSSGGPVPNSRGFTINDNHESGMIRCHTCGHRWQSIVVDPIFAEIDAALAKV